MEVSRKPAPPSNPHIWTPKLEKSFYNNISQLLLKKINQPRQPQSYPDTDGTDDGYLLAFKDELCFADQIAFLANYKEGVNYISAATVQERKTPPGLLIRLASNEKIEAFVIQELQEVFKVMETYACRKINREECQSQLFDRVLLLSSGRIYGRLCSLKGERRAYRRSKDSPLYQRLQPMIGNLMTSVERHKQELGELRQKLKELCSHYQAIENQNNATTETDLLKEAIRRTHQISTTNGNSLETSLKRLGVEKSVCENRIILQVDKIGRYWGLCKFMTWLCRQPKSRRLFRDIILETCPPFGCFYRCGKSRFVHAEIQIILSVEKKQVVPFPRAIGASKSACFLCDQFIRHHDTFRISYSHNMLYDQWTLPEVDWISDSRRTEFRTILTKMTRETRCLLHLNVNNYVLQNVQSRANLLLQKEGTETPSEMTIISDAKRQGENEISDQVSAFSSTFPSKRSFVSVTSSSITAFTPTIKSVDLSVEDFVAPAPTPLHILTSRTELFVRFIDVECGSFAVTKNDAEKWRSIDVRSLPMDRDISFDLDAGHDKMVFRIFDGPRSLFDLLLSWT